MKFEGDENGNAVGVATKPTGPGENSPVIDCVSGVSIGANESEQIITPAKTKKKESLGKVLRRELKRVDEELRLLIKSYDTDDLFNEEILQEDKIEIGKIRSKGISSRQKILLARYEFKNERTPELLVEFEACKKDLEVLLADVEAWKAEKKILDALERAEKEKSELEYSKKRENKDWKGDLKKAKKRIENCSTQTKIEFEKSHPEINKIDLSFDFDLGEKIQEYLNQSDEHVDASTGEEKDLWRRVLAASRRVNTQKSKSLIVLKDWDSNKTRTYMIESTGIGNGVSKENDDHGFSRAGSEITLGRIANFEELNALTEKEGDEKFLAKTRELWKEFAVHGFLKKDSETGEFFVANHTDLDGKCCLSLLKLAGFDISDLKHVAQGDYEEGRTNIDTGKKHGVVTEKTVSQDGNIEWGKTAYIDHHGEESPANSSATRFMYKMLVDMGLLEKNERLDKMIEFVTNVDSGIYPGIEKYFDNSWKTLYGLERFIQGDDLVRFFRKDKVPDPKKELTENELRKYGFIHKSKYTNKNGAIIDRSEDQKKVARVSYERLEQMERNGFIVQTDRYGKIAVSVEDGENKEGNKNLPGGFLAARAFGCDAFVNWNPKEKRFNISAKVPLTEAYSQGLNVREIMWVKNNRDDADLQVTLGEILTKMTDGKIVPSGKLKEYLEKELGTAIEKPKEKTPEELLDDAKAESFGVLTMRMFQEWKNGYDVTAKEHNLGDDKVGKIMRLSIERALKDHGKKEGEELEKVVQYILDKLK